MQGSCLMRTVTAHRSSNKMRGSTRAVIIYLCSVFFTRQVSKACPTPCSCTGSVVDCSSRGLSEIPKGIPSNVSTLKLHGNNLTGLPDKVFQEFTDLEKLYLFDNGIQEITRDTFAGLRGLTILDMHDNLLQWVPRDAFVGTHSLGELHLNFNRISNLSSESFRDLSGLSALHLHGNQIDALQDDLFDELASLKYLYLNGNLLTSLPETVFKKVGQLLALSLQDNMIAELPGAVFWNLRHLKSLDLSNNNITAVTTQHLYNLTNLGILKLDNNRLSAVPDLQQKKYIHSFTASHNNIDLVPEGYLNFDIQHLFDFEIDLSYNRLTKIPPFSIDTNSTFSLAMNFSGNPIRRIQPTSFDGVSDANGISRLSVDLSNTSLSELTGPVFYPFFEASVRAEMTVYLSSNHLSSLNPWVFFGLSDSGSRRLTVHLNDNPWSCDCHLREFSQWSAEPRGTTELRLKGMICDYPNGYVGKDALNLEEGDLTCHRPIFNQPVASIRSGLDGRVQLKCDVIGVPKPDLRWVTPEDELLHSHLESSPTENITVTDNGTLMIPSFQSAHRGLYTCIATNSEGTAVAFRFVELQLDPERERATTPATEISKDSIGCQNVTQVAKGGSGGQDQAATLPKVFVLIGGVLIGVLVSTAFVVVAVVVHRHHVSKSRNKNKKPCQSGSMAFSTLEKLAVRNEQRQRASGAVNAAVVVDIPEHRYSPGSMIRHEREQNYEDVDELQKSDSESEHTYLSPTDSVTENVYEALS